MKNYKIAILAGDAIGPEIMKEAAFLYIFSSISGI